MFCHTQSLVSYTVVIPSQFKRQLPSARTLLTSKLRSMASVGAWCALWHTLTASRGSNHSTIHGTCSHSMGRVQFLLPIPFMLATGVASKYCIPELSTVSAALFHGRPRGSKYPPPSPVVSSDDLNFTIIIPRCVRTLS